MTGGSTRSRPARIIELPEKIRNQIAAGEVVERPASVVKELVENALDAGAGEIRVELEEGGTRLVRVSDDGWGMGPEELALCFRPHATSKLRELEDLEHIASLGFRGEALASIGSVSRSSVLSRTQDAPGGWLVEDEGGRISEVREAGSPRGTTVEVRDLFYNTPARRRFLKRPSTELARALDVLQRLTLAHPGVGFVVSHDRARVFDVEANMDLAARIRRLFGSELADALVPVAAEDGSTRVGGLLAPPRLARRDGSRQMWFLNGRPLRDRLLSAVLRKAYHGFLTDARVPVAFLSLAMDPGQVDVNVHPTKSEVRFREERRLFGFLLGAIRAALAASDMATPGERLLGPALARQPIPQAPLPDPGTLERPLRSGARPPLQVHEPEPAEPSAQAAVPQDQEAWAARDELAGPYLQIAKTYLVRALPDGFEIVDQHALHERVTFEGLKAQLRERRVEVQGLLVPEIVELSPSEMQLLEGRLELLGEIGIQLAPFGRSSLAVHGLPALIRNPDAQALVHDLVEVLERTGKLPGGEELFEELLHRAACRSSVMAGDALADSEIRELLRRGAQLESDQTCPHGRPTRVRFTLADLEKAFERR
jgi:DNA mismatch repair protein MutL